MRSFVPAVSAALLLGAAPLSLGMNQHACLAQHAAVLAIAVENPWDDLVDMLCGGTGDTIPGVPRDLAWQISLRDKTTGQITTVSSNNSTYDLSISPTWLGVVIEFGDVQSVALPAGVQLDVDVEIKLDFANAPGLLSMNLSSEAYGPGAANTSIYSVQFPVVDVNATDQYDLAWPIGTGIVFENAVNDLLLSVLGNFTRHPGPASMQWLVPLSERPRVPHAVVLHVHAGSGRRLQGVRPRDARRRRPVLGPPRPVRQPEPAVVPAALPHRPRRRRR